VEFSTHELLLWKNYSKNVRWCSWVGFNGSGHIMYMGNANKVYYYINRTQLGLVKQVVYERKNLALVRVPIASGTKQAYKRTLSGSNKIKTWIKKIT
jgi:hypothetical protein